MTSKLTDPCTVRRIDIRAVDRNLAFLPAVRVETKWSIEIEGRWFTVVGEPMLLGDGQDQDGGRIQFLITGPGVTVVDLATFQRGERVWAKAPAPDAIATLGCIDPDCAAQGPFTLTDKGLMCDGHLADHALAETAGLDTNQEARCDDHR
ncbi:MAG: hypothetical protein ACRDVE_04395 [Actinocrinis sp.]